MFRETKNKVETIVDTGDHRQKTRLSGSERLQECSLIVVFLAAILLSVALLTFSAADPSWSQTAWGMEIENAGGIVGAWLADTLFFTFGSLAYTIPVVIALTAWVLFRKRGEDEPLDFMLWGTRLLGLTILILTSCGLADINFDDIWYFSSGGVIGDVLTSLALPTLNVLGTTLVLLFLWGAGFTLLTGISWLTIVDWIGEQAIGTITWVINKLRGEKDQVFSPTLTEPDATQPDSLEHEPREGMDTSPAIQVDSEREEPVSEVVSPQAATRRYNIHMPDNSATQASTSASETPLYHYDEQEDDEQSNLRVKQLGATIEELDAAANSANDYPPEPILTQASSELQSQEQELTPPWEDEPAFHDRDDSPLPDIEEDEQPRISSFDVVEDDPEPSFTPQEPVEAFIDEQGGSTDDDEGDFDVAQDEDAAALQNLVAEAQAKVVASQNPFLVQQDQNLPKPTEPMPTLELLYHPEKRENFIDRDALEEIARLVESKLADYKITASVVDIFPGPVITRFELDLAPGVKVSRISSLSMDLARSLSAMAVRVVEVIPGKPYVGLELPNMSRQTVYFSDVVGSQAFVNAKSPTTVVLGQDIAGEAVVADLSKMPHVLVAGTTGSGKSVGVNVMILSILYKATPEDVRFIMIDPKMLELSVYEGIPHLLSEVVTDMKDASNALRWCVGEMERRYKLMSALGVRNIKGFNDKLKMAADAGHPIHDPLWQPGDSMDEHPPLLEKLPYIVVIVDEFADLMMVVGKKVEELIARLAQKARAAGIHLILATQRPSVDVITGLIKANIPTRVAFTVSTKTDSRTILDQGGAESLLGMGDMLYLPSGSSHTIRVHGAFASDDDVHAVVNNWKARGKPNYIDEITNGDQGPEALLPGEKPEGDEEMDPLFDQVVEHVVQSRRGSVSGVQRRFKIGYNRAARIVEQLEAQGIVSAPGHNGNREVLAPEPGREMN
ncbi:DNA translocase FtsK 4TM domain-containing protein [Vibrio cholerae]